MQSDDNFTQIDFAYLNNKHTRPSDKSIDKREKQFYRKRICSLTKELLINENSLQNSIVNTEFNTFIKSCINYFKTLDNSDILQEEYKLLDLTSPTQHTPIDATELNRKQVEADELMLNMNPSSHTSVGVGEVFLPDLKNINLRTRDLRTKGVIIRKKKNIQPNYESSDQEKKSDSPTDP